MTVLADQELDGNRKDVLALTPAEIADLKHLIANWDIRYEQHAPQLYRTFRFKDFVRALHFTNQVGAMAEAADHHPVLLTEWGKVTVSWWTHSIGGLHMNDFIMAARCDALYLS